MNVNWKHRLKAWTGAAVLSTVLFGTLGGSAFTGQASAAAAKADVYHIVALGDSITVGFEPGLGQETGKSVPYGYVDRLQEQGLLHGRTRTANYAIAGLKTDGLKNYVQAIASGQVISSEAIQPALPDPRANSVGALAPEAKTKLAEADLIVLTIGGNDVSSLTQSASGMDSAAVGAKVEELLSTYSANVSSVIGTLHQLNPDAEIVLADQYQPVPAIAGKALYDTLQQAAGLLTRAADQIAADAVQQGVNVKIAHVAKEFVGGELTMTHILSSDIHPNQLGYDAIAKVFSETIWGEYRKLTAPDTGQPMNIIVKGNMLQTPYKPVLRKNENYVAIQDIVNAIGATTKWDNKTASATITYGSDQVVVKMGAPTVQVNGQKVAVSSPAFLNKVGKEDKTYVPLKVLAVGLGLDVQYDAKLKTVFINP
ncbi:GDSL-type esterase/lipase family protein [Paenibacillus sp. JX-17]|uniref:GDSL-type esterase/lipase family protein n=1 Tax=Paenibacillus lacisoli TaxID=3064525 RepID=A0ABT9CG61_9BACL|nr:stalk domain-containing protein [Paenibacillus sp. JX-17]MDO7908242.1 GDSL-type esterase/lipase family protein [Paenibacillus sp. JX-17]